MATFADAGILPCPKWSPAVLMDSCRCGALQATPGDTSRTRCTSGTPPGRTASRNCGCCPSKGSRSTSWWSPPPHSCLWMSLCENGGGKLSEMGRDGVRKPSAGCTAPVLIVFDLSFSYAFPFYVKLFDAMVFEKCVILHSYFWHQNQNTIHFCGPCESLLDNLFSSIAGCKSQVVWVGASNDFVAPLDGSPGQEFTLEMRVFSCILVN